VVTLAAILSLANDGVTANELYALVEQDIVPSVGRGLTAKELLRTVQSVAPTWEARAYLSREYYSSEKATGDFWFEKVQDLRDWTKGYQYLRSALWAGAFPIVGVNVSGSTGKVGIGTSLVYHWSAVSGLSGEWGRGSIWQWVRLYNPFNNQEEYYHADHFHRYWNYLGYANRELILLSR